MPVEIERKFLVTGDDWRASVSSFCDLRQFYLARGAHAVIRVRIGGDAGARLTVKERSPGMSRAEFEWEIPVAEARALEPLAEGRVIAKRRHLVPHQGMVWEVDVFDGGLVLAEIELADEGQSFDRPDWIGQEVTGDPAYYNAAMAMAGGSTWQRPPPFGSGRSR